MGKYQGDSGHTLVEDWEQLIAVMQRVEFRDFLQFKPIISSRRRS
jgi:hypothetical protein